MPRLAWLLSLSLVACQARDSGPPLDGSPPAADDPSDSLSSAGGAPAAAPEITEPSALEYLRALAAVLLSFDRVRAMDEQNVAHAVPVIRALVAASDSHLRLESCRMYRGTNAGQCLLSGRPEDIRQLIEGLALPARDADDEEERPASDTFTCLALPDFGVRQHVDLGTGTDRFDKVVLRPGAGSFGPGTSLPPNRRNVHVQGFYTSPSRRTVCLAFDYPYG